MRGAQPRETVQANLLSPVKSVSGVDGGLGQGVGGGDGGWNGVGVDKFALCSQVAGRLGTACWEITVHHCNTRFTKPSSTNHCPITAAPGSPNCQYNEITAQSPQHQVHETVTGTNQCP